jgi:hypothetical protein
MGALLRWSSDIKNRANYPNFQCSTDSISLSRGLDILIDASTAFVPGRVVGSFLCISLLVATRFQLDIIGK